jgi:hypothetical protein
MMSLACGQVQVSAASVGAHDLERVVHREAATFGEHTSAC